MNLFFVFDEYTDAADDIGALNIAASVMDALNDPRTVNMDDVMKEITSQWVNQSRIRLKTFDWEIGSGFEQFPWLIWTSGVAS